MRREPAASPADTRGRPWSWTSRPALPTKNATASRGTRALDATALRLRHRGVRTDLGLALRVGERSKLGRDAARDCGGFAASLEAGEVRPIAPRERTAQPHLRLDRRVVDDVDRALVVGRALAVAREVAEIAARREHGGDAGNFRNLVGVLEALQRLDHFDEHDVLVDRVAIAAGHAAPHPAVERLAAAVAAPAEGWEVGPVAGLDGFGFRVDGRHDNDERAGV